MGKFKRLANIRTVIPDVDERHSVEDHWPPRSYSGKYSLKSRVVTRVDEGEVYVEQYVSEKTPTTTIHRAGNAFAQNPDVVYAVGSVYGAKTISLSDGPIHPTFISEESDEVA